MTSGQREEREKKFNNKEEKENDLCLKTDGFCFRLIRIVRWIELEEVSHLAMAKKRNKTKKKKNNERNSSIEETKWEREREREK